MSDYKKVLKEANNDPRILGLILLGSRGKDFSNHFSDYDLKMLVKDVDAKKLRKKYQSQKLENIDLTVLSFSDFVKYADWDNKDGAWWDRYDYAHTKILIDKTKGKLDKIIKDKGYIPANKQKKYTAWCIDGYLNGVFRSVKCIRNGEKLGAHLEAVNSILDLLTVVFAFNGRHRPFLGYTDREFKKYPLKVLPLKKEVFVKKIEKVLKTADLRTQQEL